MIVIVIFPKYRELLRAQFVGGNKVKGRISKRVFQENKVRQIFPKTNFLTSSYAQIQTRFDKILNVNID